MGQRGPVPKREGQRRRRNKPEAETTHAAAAEVAERPAPADDWHPVAARLYDGIGRSGQARFYESSDWEMAWLLAESISRELKPQPLVVGRGADAKVVMVERPPQAASLAAWRAMMAALLVAEGDRRRVRLELDRPKPSAPGAEGGGAGGSVSWLDAARRGSAG